MASNLKTAKYANGTLIPNVSNDMWGSIVTGGWCHYNNDASLDAAYGKLYNWYAVSSTNSICPSGWHIPDDFDWAELIEHVGGEAQAGAKMKEENTTHWNPPNVGASNESGFTAVPGGNRRGDLNSVFETFGTLGRYWSSSQVNADASWAFDFSNSGSSIARNQFNKGYGFSCRCLRD